MKYFSEKENGERPRNDEEIGEAAWNGIRALIDAGINGGSFGVTYPEACPDGDATIGTNERTFWKAMKGDIPNLQVEPWSEMAEKPPQTYDILDIIQFCWHCIGKPINIYPHDFFKHHHLHYDIDAGREQFRDAVNRIFRRNGIAFDLTEDGSIERLAPLVLREALAAARFHSGDADLDRMLETARHKFINPDEAVRREALEALWDAWERLKTLDSVGDKKSGITALLDATATPSSPKFRESLEREATELTSIGNNLQIRHSEREQERLAKTEQVDYLFHRLFALIHVILRMNGRM